MDAAIALRACKNFLPVFAFKRCAEKDEEGGADSK
jgi:hypothetical protein